MLGIDLIRIEKEAYDNLFSKKEIYEQFINDSFPYPQVGFDTLCDLIEKDKNIIFLACETNLFEIYGLINIFNIDILSKRCNISFIWKIDFLIFKNTLVEIHRMLIENFRLKKISAYVYNFDVSIKEKLIEINFLYEAKIIDYGWKNGKYYDVEIFSLFFDLEE